MCVGQVVHADPGKAALDMSLRRYATRLSAASLSPFGEFLLRFVRTMILSHLLSPGDLGAAVVLTSILTGCEVITDIGLDKFVMVSRDGARAQVVAAARQISIARAVLLAAAIALLAPLLASAFGASEHHRIVAWLGVVPLIRSLKNWRIVQVQQDYRYGAEAVSNIGGHVAAVAAVMPAYALFHDERVMLVSLIVEAAVSVMLSYVLVRRERVAYVDPALRRAALTFGLPLMANGVGLVVLKQLDQVIVANLFGLPTLALYSLVLNLAITPTSILQRVVWNIALPFLGKSRRDDAALSQASLIVILGMMVAAAAFAIPVGLALDWLAPVIYGPQYQVGAAFSALAMLAAFLRFSRGGPNMILLDHGQTGRLTVGNMIAAIGLLVGFVLGLMSHRLEAVLVGLVIGDLLSFILLLGLVGELLSMAAMLPHLVVLGSTVAVAAAGLWLERGAGWDARGVILATSMVVIGVDAAVIYLRIIAPFAGGRLPAPSQDGMREKRMAQQLTAEVAAPGHGTETAAMPTDLTL